MPDPVTLTVPGGGAAAEGIKFLYGQAAELLKAWRDRPAKIDRGDVAPATLAPAHHLQLQPDRGLPVNRA